MARLWQPAREAYFVSIQLQAIRLFICLALLQTSGLAQVTKPVQAYSTSGQLQWPLTFLSTNVFGLSNVTLLFTNGQMWISVPAAGGGVGDAGGTNSRQFGSLNLTNWSNIPTGDMANIPAVTFLTNWANAVSNYVTAATNSPQVTNWITQKQTATASLTNLSGNPNVATNILGAGTVTVTSNNLGEWTITGTGGGDAGGTNSRQGGSLVLTNLAGLADNTYTNVPLGGTNISVRTTGGTNFIDTTGQLNNWSQFTTNVWNDRQGGSSTLTNLSGTRAFTNWTRTVITTTGASTYTTPAGCSLILIECLGGGGGGGAGSGAANQSYGCGGGGSGAYAITNISSPAATYAVIVGTNGPGGAAGANNGLVGGQTAFSNLVTCAGGLGGTGQASSTANKVALGGSGAAVATGGTVSTGGTSGGNGLCMAGTVAISGQGAGSIYGGGGAAQTAAAGGNATGYGSGGGGAAAISNAARAGGNGTQGIIVVTEFYR